MVDLQSFNDVFVCMNKFLMLEEYVEHNVFCVPNILGKHTSVNVTKCTVFMFYDISKRGKYTLCSSEMRMLCYTFVPWTKLTSKRKGCLKHDRQYISRYARTFLRATAISVMVVILLHKRVCYVFQH